MEHVIILSQAALEELVPQLSTCLHEGNLVDRRTSLGGRGDSTLGWCLKKTLLLTCSDSPIGSQVGSVENPPTMYFFQFSVTNVKLPSISLPTLCLLG